MVNLRIGTEPDHKIAINPNQVVYIQAKGNFTDIHLTNGKILLVDANLLTVSQLLKQWLERNDQ